MVPFEVLRARLSRANREWAKATLRRQFAQAEVELACNPNSEVCVFSPFIIDSLCDAMEGYLDDRRMLAYLEFEAKQHGFKYDLMLRPCRTSGVRAAVIVAAA